MPDRGRFKKVARKIEKKHQRGDESEGLKSLLKGDE